jgi:hypothetical protein
MVTKRCIGPACRPALAIYSARASAAANLDADGAVLVAFLVDSEGGLLAVPVRLQKLLAALA